MTMTAAAHEQYAKDSARLRAIFLRSAQDVVDVALYHSAMSAAHVRALKASEVTQQS